ncbi:MAG TPA: hypothetical protein VMS43_07500 [Allosphingosinicella sp.]|nr:hypothetical protein [Allosphingosinicella sp.]
MARSSPTISATLRTILGLCVLAVLLVSPADAQRSSNVLRAVARIEQIEHGARAENVILLRANRQRRPAENYDYLYDGDSLLLAGDTTRVWVRYARGTGTEILTPQSQSVVPFRGGGGQQRPGGGWRSLVERVAYWWGSGNRRVPILLVARSSDAASAAPPPLTESRLSAVFASEQSIGASRAVVVPAWRGEATRITATKQDGGELLSALAIGKRLTRIRLGTDIAHVTLTLTGRGGPITYRLTRVADGPPAPPWIGDIRDAEDAELATAAWLALEAPPQWRLEGYSRLAELADRNLAAQSLLEAVTAELVIGRPRS